MITLDNIVEKLKLSRIDWIKIDVEGSDMDVWKVERNPLKN